ncbi:MAG: VTT domain-containing protein [Candidatus Omnitrophota bacterium]
MGFRRLRPEINFIILALAIMLLWYAGRYFNLDTDSLKKNLEHIPVFYSALLYVILYVVITFFIFFSKDVLWFVGAVLFGVFFSTLLICIAEAINAGVLFHLSRYLGREYVEKNLKGKYKNLDEKFANISFFWLFVFRAAPLIPYRFMDLAAGLTSINFKKYLFAQILGSPVKMFWIQYILYGVGKSVFKDPKMLVEYFLSNRFLLIISLGYLLLILLVIYKMKKKE